MLRPRAGCKWLWNCAVEKEKGDALKEEMGIPLKETDFTGFSLSVLYLEEAS